MIGLADVPSLSPRWRGVRPMAKAKGDAYTIQVAEAKGNLEPSRSLTPSPVEYLRVKQWNGTVPYICGGGAIPPINLPAPKSSQ